ncbi:MAG: hypothetical protein N2512_02720 [Armatimonadetes bacterium]|nr:hypothetical protein [Armatimonadota bacterium]
MGGFVNRRRRVLAAVGVAAALIVVCGPAWAQPTGPYIGYIYPAGARQGTTIKATLGGQFLRGAEDVYVSGEGVAASVTEYIRPLSQQELGQVARFLRELVKRRWTARGIRAAAQEAMEMPPLPDHPWLRDLENKTPRELAELRAKLFNPKKQPNAQIAEMVEIEIKVAPKAEPGEREIRLVTAGGLTNPVRFEVSALPEMQEQEPVFPGEPGTPPSDLPVVFNGQIMPGDVDRFYFVARAGQKVVVRVHARRLIPYLADAVPGWFQAVVSICDPTGQEIAYCDDFRFDPDPALLVHIPRDGPYRLEIHDSIYRGREDFVYRVYVGELPLITHIFPLGAQEGTPATAALFGWNLPAQKLDLDTTPGLPAVRYLSLPGDRTPINRVPYMVDSLPDVAETEPNDDPKKAQKLAAPAAVNGRIGQAGDVDIFAISGRAGEDLVAEVYARRLGSPLDAALRLIGPDGAVIGTNDDQEDPEAALITHQADPYLRLRLPLDGTYLLHLWDSQGQGGEEYAYRLRVRPAQPDFALRVTPSGLNVAPGRSVVLTVHAVRKDGFDGPIDIVLKDAPPGYTLSGGRIPATEKSLQMTLNAPRDVPQEPFSLQLEGRAEIGGVVETRPVVPADDMMQAFAYHHLVARGELLVAAPRGKRVPAVWRARVPGIQVVTATPVKIPLGGTAQVQVRVPTVFPGRLQAALDTVRFSLDNAPRGVSLENSTAGPTGVTLVFKADANIATVGYSGNLIVEASAEIEQRRQEGKPARKRRIPLGVLPAIPFEVVRPAPFQ